MSLWGNETSIIFPNLGLELKNLPHGIMIGNFSVAFYGIVIAFGMVMGILLGLRQAKKTGQNTDIYMDLALWAIPISVFGARLYNCAFEWESYKDNLLQIFNLRQGGLAIYGGIIAAVLTAIIFCKVRKVSFGLMVDTGVPGLILGQIIGRWGNFFNREAFGKFTDSLFAMQIDVNDPGLTYYFKPSYPNEFVASFFDGKPAALANIQEIRDNIVTLADGRQFIQVQPTFLYESLWNVLVLIVLLLIINRKKFNGEVLLVYLGGYGLGRFIIEGVRTDQLFLWNTSIPVTRLVAALMFLVCTFLLIFFRMRAVKNGTDWRSAISGVMLASASADAKKAAAKNQINSTTEGSDVKENNKTSLKEEESVEDESDGKAEEATVNEVEDTAENKVGDAEKQVAEAEKQS